MQHLFSVFFSFGLIETDRQKKREVDEGEGMRRKAIYKFPLLDVKPKVYFFFFFAKYIYGYNNSKAKN